MVGELEKKCTELEDIGAQVQQKIQQVSDLEEKAEHMEEEIELKRIIAELRGEEPPTGYSLEELKQLNSELENLKNKSKELRTQILKGMTELDLPVSVEPEMDNEGNLIVTLDGGPYKSSVKFIANIFDSDVPMEVDGVLLHSDKLVVTKAGDMKKGLEKALIFKRNIQRMARVALGEEDLEIQKVVDYMRKSTYMDIWEIVGSKQRVVFQDLYRELGVTESGGKRRVQNFFTNSQRALRELFPFINIEPGIWERTFFGSLVWRRYHTLYISGKELKEISKVAKGEQEGEARAEIKKKTEPKIESLNKYMKPEELDKILYGNAGE